MKLNLVESPDWVAASWGVVDAFTEGDLSVDALCKEWDMKTSFFYRVVDKHPDLKDAMMPARRIRAQRYADQALELTRHTDEDWKEDQYGRYTPNTGLIQRDSLRVKTLLHLAAKLDPEQFGDRVIEEHRGEERGMLVIGDTAKAAEMIARARQARLVEADPNPPPTAQIEAGTSNAEPANPAKSKPAKPKGKKS